MRATLLAALAALALAGVAGVAVPPAPALAGARHAPARAAARALALAPVRALGLHAHAHAARVRARRAARRGPTVTTALRRLRHSAAISAAAFHQDYSAYVAAKRSLRRLSGTRRTELGAVLGNVQAMASAGELTPSRLPAVFLTLERNRQWWTTKPLLSGEVRVSFPGSRIVWEHYPGQGIEIQWLATFGEANGYYLSGHQNAALRQLLEEVIPLATSRAGGIAWEYMFQFDGGRPPWTSGLSQGTALQVLARAYSRFGDPEYLHAAQQALGVFRASPPQGVRVSTPAGALYAEYTYAPDDRILNGFIQALVGLYDYTSITKDPLGLALFEAGDAEARAIVPRYDTGAWSLYDQFGESDLNYHELLTEFLQHLCERTRKGAPLAPAAPPPAAPQAGSPAAPAPSPSTTPSSTGGASAAAVHRAQSANPIPGDEIYCTTAQRFTADLRTPPAISLLSRTLRARARAGVRMSLSKIATVHMTVRHGSHVVWTNTATVEGGKPRLLWITPSGRGTFTVSLTATDLAGNVSRTSGTVRLRRR